MANLEYRQFPETGTVEDSSICLFQFSGSNDYKKISVANLKNVFGSYGPQLLIGIGSPEGVVNALSGSLYIDGSIPTLYMKVTGTGNVGWV